MPSNKSYRDNFDAVFPPKPERPQYIPPEIKDMTAEEEIKKKATLLARRRLEDTLTEEIKAIFDEK